MSAKRYTYLPVAHASRTCRLARELVLTHFRAAIRIVSVVRRIHSKHVTVCYTLPLSTLQRPDSPIGISRRISYSHHPARAAAWCSARALRGAWIGSGLAQRRKVVARADPLDVPYNQADLARTRSSCYTLLHLSKGSGGRLWSTATGGGLDGGRSRHG